METLELKKDMPYIKCFNKEGELLDTHANVERKGKLVVLKVGSFKQTIHIDKYKKLCKIAGKFEDAVIVKEDNDKQKKIDFLESKTKEELQHIAKQYYQEDQIDGRFGKPKLIELIIEAEG